MRTLMLVGLLAVAQQISQPPGPTPLATEHPPLAVNDPTLPTLFLVGDSTVKVGTTGQMGWGEVVGDYFDRERINVVNYARGGRSSRTVQTEGLWARVVAAMRPGDYVHIQFGHNDGGELFETTRPRGSLAGTGDDTRAGTVALTRTFEVVRTFGWYVRQYVSDARARRDAHHLFTRPARTVDRGAHHARAVCRVGAGRGAANEHAVSRSERHHCAKIRSPGIGARGSALCRRRHARRPKGQRSARPRSSAV
jgi:hypothetical protein